MTMSTLGSNGRLGNQLFQYASLIGLSKTFGHQLRLPAWPYAQYFEGYYPEGEITDKVCREVKETVFHYMPSWPALQENDSVDVFGYLQSQKYWINHYEDVRRALTFKKEFVEQVRAQFESTHEPINNAIAISIRRGDYVNNPNYAQLPIISYYFMALMENFPDWQQRQIIIFSDNIPYCRVHFGTLPNVAFSENNSDIEDICLMSQCTDFVVGNSTFAWWGAYLSKLHGRQTRVVRSVHHFEGKLLRMNDTKDHYPEEWIPFDYKPNGRPRRLNLKDTTFTIPVSYDHEDRKDNLNMCLRILQKDFDTSISVCEQTTNPKSRQFDYVNDPKSYHRASCYTVFLNNKFHRTRMLNDMARAANTAYVFNWDADVVIPPIQIWQAVELLRSGADMVYPYAWAFARMPRQTWFQIVRNYEDIGMVGDTRFNGMNVGDAVSLGGAVGFRKQSFIEGGMENEHFISYGAEDVERKIRFEALGYRIERTLGPNLYHMNHWVGVNSTVKNPDFKRNEQELHKVKTLASEPHKLKEYIKTWPWISQR